MSKTLTRLVVWVAWVVCLTGAGVVGQARTIPAGYLFVCVQDDARIAVVDTATTNVVQTVDLQKLGFPATAKPHYIVVEPNRQHWYVSLIGANTVVKFNAANEVVAKFEMETPGMLALSAADQLVVTRSMSAVNPPKRIGVIDRRTMQGEEVDVLFPRPHPLAVQGTYAYTGSLGTNQIASISLETNRVNVVAVDGSTHAFVQFAVSPDGKTMVASTEVSGQLMVFDITDPAKPVFRKSIALGKMVFDPVFSPDGTSVWVAVKMDNEIALVNTSTWDVTTRIKHESFKQPHQVVFSADGSKAFVTNNNKMDHMADPAHAGHTMPGSDGAAALVVIDTTSLKVLKSEVLGKNLTGMGIAR
jgi:DNA-binding beta-propeller fold protein YncE